MKILTKKAVTLRGALVPPGEVIEVDDKSGAALIASGAGKEVETPAASTEGSTEGGTEGSQEDEQAAALERIRAAIDSQYRRDELAVEAKKADVDFAFDAKKADIIQAVIDQDKVAAVLK